MYLEGGEAFYIFFTVAKFTKMVFLSSNAAVLAVRELVQLFQLAENRYSCPSWKRTHAAVLSVKITMQLF
jgi:hypothetical protein